MNTQFTNQSYEYFRNNTQSCDNVQTNKASSRVCFASKSFAMPPLKTICAFLEWPV